MRGILFTELLFHKTVDGSKTMTRREHGLKKINDSPDDWETHYGGLVKTGQLQLVFNNLKAKISNVVIGSHYKVDEVLYLKEPTFLWGDKLCVYKYGAESGSSLKDGTPFILKDKYPKWSNKLFMPNERARYFIKITGIKCERLFNISYEDCLKEGVEMDYFTDEESGYMMEPMYMDYQSMKMNLDFDPKKSFFSLFRFANRIPKSKEIKNIWCFVYDYVLCDKEGKPI